MSSAENDALLDTLERLVYLLERGEYVPFSLITEARSIVDATRAKCGTCGGPVEVRAGEPVCVSESYLPHPATRPIPPAEKGRGNA